MKTLHHYVKPAVLAFGLIAANYTPSAFAAPQSLDFITLSDIHLNTRTTKKMVISPTKTSGSNLDQKTFTTLLTDSKIGIANVIKTNLPNAKFVIITGDIPGHVGTSSRVVYLQSALKQLKTNINLPLFFVMGNNDSAAKNYGHFIQKNIKISQNAGWNDPFLSTGVTCYKGYPCLYQENKHDGEGYYAAYLQSGLKFIGLNTILFHQNTGTPETSPKELRWLSDQLKDSANKRESVLIGMHMPPSSEWRSKQLKEFLSIIKKYPNTVIGILAGHTHTENVKAISAGKKIIPIIFTAGLSTNRGNAPSFKYFSLTKKDSSSPWVIKDYTTYHYIQKKSSDPITLKKYYSFDSVYCPNKNTTVGDCMIANMKGSSFTTAFKNKVKQRYYTGNPNNPSNRHGVIIFEDDMSSSVDNDPESQDEAHVDDDESLDAHHADTNEIQQDEVHADNESLDEHHADSNETQHADIGH